MNNFAALNMLNIGFIQFVLEEEPEYNDFVEQKTENTKNQLGEELAET